MSAIAYAYSIYPFTEMLVSTIAERLQLSAGSAGWLRSKLRESFERHAAALIDAIPLLTAEELLQAIEAASLEPGRIDPAAVRAVIEASRNLMGDPQEDLLSPATVSFEEVIAAGLTSRHPGVEDVVRGLLVSRRVPFPPLDSCAPPSGPPPASRAAVRPHRLVFDDATRIVVLDGVPDPAPLEPVPYQLLKALGAEGRCGRLIPGRDITGPGLAGKKLARVLAQLPARWRGLINSQKGSGGGYSLTLPLPK